MNFVEIFIAAFSALKSNKVRTFLTALGIIIGVFSVVLLVSLVRGVQNYVTDQFNSIGSNLLFIAPGRAGINRDPATSFTDNKLSEDLSKQLSSQEASYILEVSPTITAGATLNYKSKKYFSSVNGGYANYADIFNTNLDHGRFFNAVENAGGKKVVVLGASVAKNLFNDKNPVGESIKIDKSSFEVIGVLGAKSQDIDEAVAIPFTTTKNVLKATNISYILVKLKPEANIDESMKKIDVFMLKYLKKDDFTVLSQGDILKSIQNILQILSFGLGAVAAISLLVGGIGIMNIMLVAVAERIKEIGLRKALGATSGGIALQFMLESVILSLSGGAIGLILGTIASLFARKYIRTEVPMWAFLLSVGFSLAVGVIFGTYPAYKASKKEPIEALRYE